MKKMMLFLVLILFLLALGACQEHSTTQLTTSPSSSLESTTTISMTDTHSTTFPSMTMTLTESSKVTVEPLIDRIHILTESIQTDQLLELALYEPSGNEKIATDFNPYDYDQIRLEMIFSAPSGKTLRQNAFWFWEYRDHILIGETYDEEGYLTSGQEMVRGLDEGISHYLVRIRPDEVGKWDYTLEVRIEENLIQTKTGSFQVTEYTETSRGFIQVDSANNRQFVFSRGTSYLPVGANFGWWASSLGTYDYYNWFKHLESSGGNYARIWMSHRAFSIHRYSYSNFDSTQNIAIRLDTLFRLAEENGVYLMLTLINHGQFSAVTNPNWGINPYNKANGGMLDLPIQFFYNSDAKRWYRNELRYLIARYSHSEHLFAWELFNEVDWVDGYNSGIVTRWHSDMATWIKENDPYQHLVTTSYKFTYGCDAYLLKSIDFGAVHSYEYYDTNFIQKLATEIDTLSAKYDKPIFFGEIGIDWQNGANTYAKDPTGITLHQGLWAGIMTGAGGAMQWWWDSWIDLHDLWYRFDGIGAYARQMDLAGKTLQDLRKISGVSLSNGLAGLMGVQTETATYGYLYHKLWTYSNPDPGILEDVVIEIPVSNNTYTLTFFDTTTGAFLEARTIIVTNGQIQFQIDSLEKDLAFTIQ